ncbi:putative membrane protein (Fun14 family) [Scopulibacillus daqui]|uniref:Membrane protein (Fun14 family) n=1 Tax=Scopulibacillus daqui TaxID=1469162 RepID=A0ABS2PVI1_9BACL|nr:hypothetical protein [Scopulibacillus daqui]MBM7643973.1 putative membrane protein (Fun14 family) [Scopulibacillus daqui]
MKTRTPEFILSLIGFIYIYTTFIFAFFTNIGIGDVIGFSIGYDVGSNIGVVVAVVFSLMFLGFAIAAHILCGTKEKIRKNNKLAGSWLLAIGILSLIINIFFFLISGILLIIAGGMALSDDKGETGDMGKQDVGEKDI